MRNIIQTEKSIFGNIYLDNLDTYTYITMINEKISHKFEIEWEGGVLKGLKEASVRDKWCNYVILSKINENIEKI